MASVFIIRSKGLIILVIEDNGCGMDLAEVEKKKRLGIVGIRERAELLGGVCILDSEQEKGTIIRVEIPVEESDE